MRLPGNQKKPCYTPRHGTRQSIKADSLISNKIFWYWPWSAKHGTDREADRQTGRQTATEAKGGDGEWIDKLGKNTGRKQKQNEHKMQRDRQTGKQTHNQRDTQTDAEQQLKKPSRKPTLELVKPLWLVVVFWCQNTSVEKDKNDDEPIECLRLNGSTTTLATSAIQLWKTSPVTMKPRHGSHCNTTSCYLKQYKVTIEYNAA